MSAPVATSRARRVTLTTRGASLLAAGVAIAGGAVVLGETDLLRIAAAVIALCVLCWAYLKLSGLTLHTRHAAVPHEAPVGAPVAVHVPLRIEHRLLLLNLIVQDEVSAGLIEAPRLGVDPVAASAGLTVRYPTACRHRGLHYAGGTTATMHDPFGIAEVRVQTGEQAAILGLPYTVPVNRGWLRALAARDGVHRAGSTTTLSEPDIDVREHRPEDGLRRVHWRTSARVGRLMVRPDEPVEDRADVLVLDTRGESHFGHSFETLIALAASLGRAMTEAGGTVELRTWDGKRIGEHAFTDKGPLLRTLALLTPGSGGEYAAAHRAPTLLVTTESADLQGLDGGTRGWRPLAIVLTRRPGATADVHAQELAFGERGLACAAHCAHEPVGHLLGRPPVIHTEPVVHGVRRPPVQSGTHGRPQHAGRESV